MIDLARWTCALFALTLCVVPLQANHYFQNIGPWTGRLELPSVEDRQEDGSVIFHVTNAPDTSLIGKTLRLRWDREAPRQEWYEQVRVDMNIGGKLYETAIKQQRYVPMRLQGWSRVSSLESMAGAHPEDDVEVELKNPRLFRDELFVTCEPTLIVGHKRALVQFCGPPRGSEREVVHYNPQSGLFDGPLETVNMPDEFDLDPDTPFPWFTGKGIESEPLNEWGFYVYGEPGNNGQFNVRALEPRALFLLTPDHGVLGKRGIKHYVKKGHFANMVQGLFRRTTMGAEGSMEGYSSIDEYAAARWPVGKKALLLHVFGGRKTKDESWTPGKKIGMWTGHFSFGIAEVVKCSFTGEARFDIEYRQVYCHNKQKIICGTHKWHSYMGTLIRGWLFQTVVSDSIVHIPELMEDYTVAGQHYSPLEGLLREFEKMASLYRTGAGTGVCLVRSDISCVQDSHCALYSALKHFEAMRKEKSIKRWMKENSGTEDVQRFKRLIKTTKRVMSKITFFGFANGDWRKFVKDPLGSRHPNCSTILQYVKGLQNAKTLIPRRGHDNLLRLGADLGYDMWSILTAACVGDIPGLEPTPPTSLLIKN